MRIEIRAALDSFFRKLPGWFRTRYFWALLIIPAAWMIAVHHLADADFMGWSDSDNNKALMEIIHPGLLAVAVFIAASGWLLMRNTSVIFLGVLCALFLAREIGGQGTSFVTYTGLLILIIYGHSIQLRLAILLDSRLASSCLATGVISYVVSQLLDRGTIKGIGRLFTGDSSWDLSYTSQIEESLETMGGGFLLLTVIVVLALVFMHRSGHKSPGAT